MAVIQLTSARCGPEHSEQATSCPSNNQHSAAPTQRRQGLFRPNLFAVVLVLAACSLLAHTRLNPLRCSPYGQGRLSTLACASLGQRGTAEPATEFLAPASRCAVLVDGSVRLPAAVNASSSANGVRQPPLPFLFDTASMPNNSEACGHCPEPDDELPLHCCGVCQFEEKACEEVYPGASMHRNISELLMRSGLPLQALTPCELFQRIRGRTLWFAGDSQTWAFFLSAECFLREFALTLNRTPAVMPEQENNGMKFVKWISAPVCLDLAHNTRVCGVRVDTAADLQTRVLHRLVALASNFSRDIVVLNTGLHYPEYDRPEEPPPRYVDELSALAEWKQAHQTLLPQFVWMDTPPQHFSTSQGTFPGHGLRPFTCRPLQSWYDGDPVVVAGTRRGIAAAPFIAKLADAHLHIYNASVPLWVGHIPGECSHWCQPGAYQLWLFLLNDALRDGGLGNVVEVPGRPAAAKEALR